MVTAAVKSERFASGQENYDKPGLCVEKQRHYSATKGPCSQGYGLPSGHMRLWELDCKEGRAPKNWCFWTVVLEKPLESPLHSKEIKPVGKTDAEVETAVFWSSYANTQLNGKVSWCWERLRAEREWDGWMASPMKWIWTWTNFGRWWKTERPGMLQSTVSLTVRHTWTTEQQIHI